MKMMLNQIIVLVRFDKIILFEIERGVKMPNRVFFSFKEDDRDVVVTIKGRAENSRYQNLNFRVQSLLERWNTKDEAVIKRAISTKLKNTSRTIVFVGYNTYNSYWVPKEVEMTLEAGKPVYAIRLKNTRGVTPSCLTENDITLHSWSESKLQELATK